MNRLMIATITTPTNLGILPQKTSKSWSFLWFFRNFNQVAKFLCFSLDIRERNRYDKHKLIRFTGFHYAISGVWRFH